MRRPSSHLRRVHQQAAAAVEATVRAAEERRGGGTVKSRTLQEGNVNKKATHALTCETLRYLPIIKEVLAATDLLPPESSKKKPQHWPALLWVLVYDLLFGVKELEGKSAAEKAVLSRRNALQASLARIMVKRRVASADQLLPAALQAAGEQHWPRCVRVNRLKATAADVIKQLQGDEKLREVQPDPFLPDVLRLPAGSDLHQHPLVTSGQLILQGWSSCVPAVVLNPHPSWQVLDACAAPGNKTSHLAALLASPSSPLPSTAVAAEKGRGGKKGGKKGGKRVCGAAVLACERDEKRAALLKERLQGAGATNVEVIQGDFLRLAHSDPRFANVRAVLVDPSCSGSGTQNKRMDDWLQPGNNRQEDDDRIERLARFQTRILEHALSFPCVERVVYSTCSLDSRENEGVVEAVLPLAQSLGFHLERALPQWPRRGLSSYSFGECVLRTSPSEDCVEGFFVALLVRNMPLKDS